MDLFSLSYIVLSSVTVPFITTIRRLFYFVEMVHVLSQTICVEISKIVGNYL